MCSLLLIKCFGILKKLEKQSFKKKINKLNNIIFNKNRIVTKLNIYSKSLVNQNRQNNHFMQINKIYT